MTHDRSQGDGFSLSSLWQSEQEDFQPMTQAQLQVHARRFRSGVLWRNSVEYAAAALVVFVFGAWSLRGETVLISIGAALVVAGAVFVSWKLHTLAGASRPWEPSDGCSMMDAHRAQLMRQRDALRTVWRWYLLPFAPGLLTLCVGMGMVPVEGVPRVAMFGVSALALLIVGAVFGGIGWMNASAARKLDAEIKALDRS